MQTHHAVKVALAASVVTVAGFAVTLAGQTFGVEPDGLPRYTPQHTGERFPDGRPKVPDAVLAEMREMNLEIEEAYGVLNGKGYTNQYSADWKVLVPAKRLIGRAFTVQFMPTRPDLADGLQKDADAQKVGRLRNQTAIDMLQKDD